MSRIPAILFDGNCRHASSHRRRWCLSSIQKQENDWSSHCQFIPVPVQTIETIEIFTGTERDEVEIQVVEDFRNNISSTWMFGRNSKFVPFVTFNDMYLLYYYIRSAVLHACVCNTVVATSGVTRHFTSI